MHPKMNDADVLSELQNFAERAANAPTPETLFKLAENTTKVTIGHNLFTVMAFDQDRMEVQRCYSSDPDSYPVGGRKKKRDTDWGRHVLTQGQPIIGSSEDDIRRFFDDHKVIIGLGLCAVMNVPIKRLGTVIGTMNLLDISPHYTADDIKIATLITLGLGFALPA
tara:strand:+ start:51159 stop:51656 length:498 start_codon:yes stop_codon:yes gene_type:complete